MKHSTQLIRIIMFLKIIFLSSVCFAAEPATDLSDKQLKSIYKIPWGSTINEPFTVPPITQKEIQSVKRWAKKEKSSIEVKLLRNVFQNHWNLWAFARRDTDKDGIYDYRVNTEGKGRFYEGDIDIDGDGIRNIQDHSPFTSSEFDNDINENGIADHIDWRLTREGETDFEELARLQEELFTSHDILLFERSAKFPLVTAQAVYDTVTLLFPKGLPTLKQVSSEDYAWLEPDGGETNAMVFTPSQSMMIYANSLNSPPIFQLGLIVHEMAHSYQYALDWNEKTLNKEFSRSYFHMKNFKKMMRPFSWKPRKVDLIPEWKTLKKFASLSENKHRFLYRNKTPKWWESWIDSVWQDHGYSYLDAKRVTQKGIVGEYSLTSPLEWHADQLNAYVISRIEDHVTSKLSNSEAEELSTKLRESEQITWPGFKHSNVRRSITWTPFSKTFPISNKKLKELGRRYLNPSTF